MSKTKKLSILVLLFSLLLATGCGTLTRENYNKLKVGMDYSEVVSILGNPDNCSEVLGAKSCIWGKEEKNITVAFLADKTMIFTSTGIK